MDELLYKIHNYKEQNTPWKISTAGNHVVYIRSRKATGIVHVNVKNSNGKTFPATLPIVVFEEWGASLVCRLQQKAEGSKQYFLTWHTA